MCASRRHILCFFINHIHTNAVKRSSKWMIRERAPIAFITRPTDYADRIKNDFLVSNKNIGKKTNWRITNQNWTSSCVSAMDRRHRRRPLLVRRLVMVHSLCVNQTNGEFPIWISNHIRSHIAVMRCTCSDRRTMQTWMCDVVEHFFCCCCFVHVRWACWMLAWPATGSCIAATEIQRFAAVS